VVLALAVLCAPALVGCSGAPAATGAETAITSAPASTAAPPAAVAIATAMATDAPTATAEPTATKSPEEMPLVALDAGHGGIDLGAPIVNAAGKLDTYESKINLELILALRDELHRRGYRTLLTRDGDYQLVEYLEEGAPDINGDGEHNYLDDLQARIDLINENQADLLLSIHQNAYVDGNNVRDPSVGGTVVYYCADRPYGDESWRFAALVEAHIEAAFNALGYTIANRGVLDDVELAEPGQPGQHLVLLGPQSERIVRPSIMPGVLSETVFLTQPDELALVRDPEVQAQLAVAYADAIDAYFAGEAPAATPTPEGE
jgi:N-acetylmuramoyl-L-alanine amidase